MGNKIRPDSMRLGITKPWRARWFFKGGYQNLLLEDEVIRKMIKEKMGAGGIASIDIERTSGECKVFIKASRPGLIIGRGGQGIEDLKKVIEKETKKASGKKQSFPLNISIEELKRTEVSSFLVAQQIAGDIERRQKFRRTIKRYLDQIMQNRDAKGAKIRISGRLDGAEIARSEWLSKGTLPLQTLRADIDFGQATAFTTYGTIGIKVWINKGEIFRVESQQIKAVANY
ncbi:MAG: 30S ribosomal protein S3 [Candidatus Liptonbacteria bacterium RIFOXYB1_FULL_36_10]|uniref:Small ribosomal subunit protein uS3 n=2 Tax=Candidatus Liptoniibacteriota TaxID=1817909 RepID=A0A1G2CRH5_9BACT|nr:MAG: 30S ribosomal protein S3 [Candidatus Liptonbacteria bacterium RIFOXYB1_FULL_36_10]OGZ04545.1 MAG: 30S ribosomal protein S3 [Candidatus Liptonbacteria bacterium RIFOXYD1_FULL_36_11]